MRLPLQDGRQMKEEAIERVAKHIVIESYDSGKDIVMKGKRNLIGRILNLQHEIRKYMYFWNAIFCLLLLMD